MILSKQDQIWIKSDGDEFENIEEDIKKIGCPYFIRKTTNTVFHSSTKIEYTRESDGSTAVHTCYTH